MGQRAHLAPAPAPEVGTDCPPAAGGLHPLPEDVQDWINAAHPGERAELCRRIREREAMHALAETDQPNAPCDPAYENEAYCPACESHPCICDPPLDEFRLGSARSA
jgi:hypothetical protein